MPADYGLIQPSVRLNTPFENLATVLHVRAQQENIRGLREQRDAIAEQRRAQTEKIQRDAAEATAVRALFTRPDKPPTMDELSGVIGPEKAADVFKGFEAVRTARTTNAKADVDRIASVLGGLEALPAAMRPEAYAGALKVLTADGTLKPGQAPAVYNPAFVNAKRREALTALEQFAQDKPPADYTLGNQRMSGATNQPIATAAPATGALGSAADFVAKWAADRRLDPAKLSAGQTAAALRAHAQSTHIATETAQEPLVPIIGPDGQPVLVPRSQAAGKRPASSREQGRPVTSGDAGRIADLDTSLNDLDVLTNTLGTTGAGSKVGAMLPNVVTEVTGWGADSKARQGTIDRVKQVIGKALEGGVLRKEDEIKYEKILPTIGDPPSVAKAKLEGLQKALVQRRQTTLDALKDAGYETSSFEQRTRTPPAGVEEWVRDASGKLVKKAKP